MKILILTQYYPPETGAPQNRLSSLAGYLQAFGNEVEILTAFPNYPHYKVFEGYRKKWYCREYIENTLVHRSYIFASPKTGRSLRLFNYFSFGFSALLNGWIRIQKPDLIICESPPLFLGITAVLLKKKWRCKLVFNVSDLWPESAEKMGIVTNKWLIHNAYRLAKWIYHHANLISGQTQGIVKAIETLAPGKPVYWLPNGIDMKRFSTSNNYTKHNENEGMFTLLYAGILGHAQGLEVILHAAEQLKNHSRIRFVIIGDGPVKKTLFDLQQKLKIQNTLFLPNQSFHDIAGWLHTCDAYIVPLKKLDLFKGAIPSKLFEPLAFGKPILLGVDGEARELFIDDARAGLHFEPENHHALVQNILTLYHQPELANQLGMNGQKYVLSKFEREKIAEDFWKRLQLI